MDDPKALVPGPAVTADTIERYSGVVPEVLLSTWRDHGLATTANGFVRLVDPATVVDLVSETTERHARAVPLFTTALGDIGVLNDGYIQILKYRHGLVSTVTDRPEWLFKIIGTTTGREDARHLDWSPFPEAVERLGVPGADECFGYVPLLVLGGSETADKLEIVSLREHILLITQFAGPLRQPSAHDTDTDLTDDVISRRRGRSSARRLDSSVRPPLATSGRGGGRAS